MSVARVGILLAILFPSNAVLAPRSCVTLRPSGMTYFGKYMEVVSKPLMRGLENLGMRRPSYSRDIAMICPQGKPAIGHS